MDVTEPVRSPLRFVPYATTTTSFKRWSVCAILTSIEVLPATATSVILYPTEVITKTAFAGALILNVPSAAVVTAVLVPFTVTVADNTGEPSLLSVTLPVTAVCANPATAISSIAIVCIKTL